MIGIDLILQAKWVWTSWKITPYTTAAAWVVLTTNRKATNTLDIDQPLENDRGKITSYLIQHKSWYPENCPQTFEISEFHIVMEWGQFQKVHKKPFAFRGKREHQLAHEPQLVTTS
jgi:hypothetical protein